MDARLCGRAHAVERNQGKTRSLDLRDLHPRVSGRYRILHQSGTYERIEEPFPDHKTVLPYFSFCSRPQSRMRVPGKPSLVALRIIPIEPHATKLLREDRLGESCLTAASSVERLRCDRGKYGHDFRLAQYGVAIGPSKMGPPGAIFRTVLGNFRLRNRQGLRIAASKF
jgi:hypothetical protein